MSSAQAEKRSALLIGVGQYAKADMLPPLAGPQVDVASMKVALEHPVIGGYNVETLENVESQVACTRIEEFLGSRSEDETVLLFYSGHGFIDRRGSLYLCTTNSSFATPKTSTIRADFLTDLIDNCNSKRLVLLLDCCYAGNFEGSAKAANVIEPQFAGTGLGRVVLTAGAENQLAWDNGAAGSLFSRSIVQGLTTGAADMDNDGRVTVQELYDYVYREVTKERPQQRPGKCTYREDGPSFLIAQSPVQPKRELPAEMLYELGSDFARTRLSALRSLEQFAERNSWARDPVMEKLRAALVDDSDSVKATAREALQRMSATAETPAAAETKRPAPAPPSTRSETPQAIASPAPAAPAPAKVAPPRPPRTGEAQRAAPAARTVSPGDVASAPAGAPRAKPRTPPKTHTAEKPPVAEAPRTPLRDTSSAPRVEPQVQPKPDTAPEFPLGKEALLWGAWLLIVPQVFIAITLAFTRYFELGMYFAGGLSVIAFVLFAAVRYRVVNNFSALLPTREGVIILGAGAACLILFVLAVA